MNPFQIGEYARIFCGALLALFITSVMIKAGLQLHEELRWCGQDCAFLRF